MDTAMMDLVGLSCVALANQALACPPARRAMFAQANGPALLASLFTSKSLSVRFYSAKALHQLACPALSDCGFFADPACLTPSMRISSAKTITARNDNWSFESLRSSVCAQGKAFYEVVIQSSGVVQIGWARADCNFQVERGHGVGDDAQSYAFDGVRFALELLHLLKLHYFFLFFCVLFVCLKNKG
eukprot:m.235600 g.235600  ORF g.235600 m.235600 type:complete len:187 (-) comp22484_c0_seq3:460-1020(-)